MTISRLKTFVAVCQSMSFTEAAARLYISQPAVSRQISALEEELDAVLFERSHSTIQLTPAGSHITMVRRKRVWWKQNSKKSAVQN